MDEDETVVLKHTGLYSHLREAGFDDFEVVEQRKRSSTPLPDLDDSLNYDKMHPVQDYHEFEKLINIVLESHLVYNDDVLFVKNFTIHMKPLSKSSNVMCSDLAVKTLFVSTGCLACSACGVKLKPWALVSLHMIPFGIHTIKHLYLLYCKRRRRKMLERLLKNLKKLSLLMQKSIQFVYESEIFAYNDLTIKTSSFTMDPNIAYIGELQAMNHLRMSIFHAIRSAVLDFRRLIIVLIEKFPLKSHVDSMSYHLAFLDEIDLQCAYTQEPSISVQQLQRMKYVCLLLQSEFLRQLSLCFIPSLWVCNTDILLRNTFALLADFSQRCLNRYQQLKSIFEVYYTCEKTATSAISSPDTKWVYKEAYLKSCSLSFNLQSVLKGSRLLEEFLEETRASDTAHGKIVQRLDNMSERIAKDYTRCQTALDDLRRYVVNLKPKTSPCSTEIENTDRETSSIKTNVLLGVTDFSPMWPDEVFVGVSEVESNVTETESASFGEVAQKPPPKLFLNELKGALQSKAKEWKEREKVALKSKNIDVDDEGLTQVYKRKLSSSSEEELSSIHNQTCSLQESEYKFKPIPVDESSFAKIIHEKSAAWGMQSEEFVGDDEEG